MNPLELGSDVSKANVLILGEKGVSCHNISTGVKSWSVKTKKGEFAGIFGKTMPASQAALKP